MLAIGGSDSITLWDTATWQPVTNLDSHTDYVGSVAFNSDGSLLATGSSDGTIYVWDVASGQQVAMLTSEMLPEEDYLRSIAFLSFRECCTSGARQRNLAQCPNHSRRLPPKQSKLPHPCQRKYPLKQPPKRPLPAR
jgi:WD40 repeat protein